MSFDSTEVDSSQQQSDIFGVHFDVLGPDEGVAGILNRPLESFLAKMQKPPVSHQMVLEMVRFRLKKTKRLPEVGSPPTRSRASIAKPLKERRISMGVVQT